jgi:hypothetical protein
MSVATSILKASQGFVILPLALGLVSSCVNTWLLRVLTFLSLVSRKALGFILPGAFPIHLGSLYAANVQGIGAHTKHRPTGSRFDTK